MSASPVVQRDLLSAANEGRLTVSGLRYYIDGVETDVDTKWAATDLLGDGLLFIPGVSRPAKHKLVRPTVRGLAVLDGTEATR